LSYTTQQATRPPFMLRIVLKNLSTDNRLQNLFVGNSLLYHFLMSMQSETYLPTNRLFPNPS